MISTEDMLRQIAVKVVYSDHIDFLKNFANAYLGADTENEKILRDAWMRLIKKYRLDLLQDIEEERAKL